VRKIFDILLVDDEKDFLDPIAFWMEAKGYSVRLAANGEEAIKRIQQSAPDIVLLDVNMPVMDGIETLRRIRADYKKMPVIMITAELEKLPALYELGISGFFPKGGSLGHLEKMLDPLIRLHEKMKPAQ
jgi:CheY-like chemotaxis protein